MSLALTAVWPMSALATEGTLVVAGDTTLTEDHVGNIEVLGDGIDLDCDGHSVTGDGTQTGIRVTGADVSVVDCVLAGFDIGIHTTGQYTSLHRNLVSESRVGLLISGDDSDVVDNVAVGSEEVGVRIASAQRAEVTSNHSEQSGLADYELTQARSIDLVENVSMGGTVGFWTHDESSYIHLARNEALHNTSHAFLFEATDRTAFYENFALDAGGDGFHLSEVNTSASFHDNHSHSNAGRGYFDDGQTQSAIEALDVGWPPPYNVYWYRYIPVLDDPGNFTTLPGNRCVDNGSSGGGCEVGTFRDDDGNTFEVSIEWLFWKGITNGCNPPATDRYCPDGNVTRGEMAAFLVRALGYPGGGPSDVFVDDDASIFEADIDKLAAAGVTRGCNPPVNDRFCPDDFVTRGQMAAFLVRALDYTDDGGGDLFTDDDGTTFETDIDKLGTAGVTRGCNPPVNDRFCPDDFVTRGQMAAFLHRALGN